MKTIVTMDILENESKPEPIIDGAERLRLLTAHEQYSLKEVKITHACETRLLYMTSLTVLCLTTE